MNSIINFIKPYINSRLLLGIVIGGLGGYVYYYFIGCNSGSCSITSDPLNSTLYGVLFGVLLFYKKKEEKPESKN